MKVIPLIFPFQSYRRYIVISHHFIFIFKALRKVLSLPYSPFYLLVAISALIVPYKFLKLNFKFGSSFTIILEILFGDEKKDSMNMTLSD